MWPDGVGGPPPAFDHNLGLLEAVKDFAIQQLVTQLAVEGFAVAILPRTAGHCHINSAGL